jgi:hypothetical protein
MVSIDDYSISLDDFPNNFKTSKLKKEQNTIYYHFDKSNDCENFMKLISPQYKITNTCCFSIDEKGYKGFGVDLLFEPQVGKLYNKFMKDIEKSKKDLEKPKLSKLRLKTTKSDIEICCVCHEICDYRTFCKHALCNDCLQIGGSKFKLRLCPICRNELKEY